MEEYQILFNDVARHAVAALQLAVDVVDMCFDRFQSDDEIVRFSYNAQVMIACCAA